LKIPIFSIWPRQDVRYEKIPEAYAKEVKTRRVELFEALSNVDDHIADLFLNEKTPSNKELKVLRLI
jgi:hypothetical protein